MLHGDNGSTLKATTVLAMLNGLGVKPSYSRPRVSDDNAYAEALFRTAKYRPEFSVKGFADLDEARAWMAGFVRGYNFDHRHSGIRYVSPAQRHASDDHAILAARGMRCTSVLVSSTRLAGPAARAIGRPWARWRSTPSATRSCRRIREHQIFSRWLHERGDNYLDARRNSSVASQANHIPSSNAPLNATAISSITCSAA